MKTTRKHTYAALLLGSAIEPAKHNYKNDSPSFKKLAKPEKIMTKSILPVAFAGALAASISITQAATLVGYDFSSGNINTTAKTATQTSGDLDGGTLAFGTFANGGGSDKYGISSSSLSLFFRTNSTGADAASGDTLAEAISNNAYVTFDLTNNSGSDYSLSSLTFDIWNQNERAADSFFSVFGMSDQSPFTDGNEFGSFTVTDTTVGISAITANPASLNLSSLSTFTNGSTIEFRLYMADDTDLELNIYRVDNIVVNGAVIPEPSSLLLSGLAGLALILRRRR
jgi:hypothetical protein